LTTEVTKKETNELAEFGDPKVWIKRTPTGEIRSVRADMVLREEQGELVEVEGKLTISAKGYYQLNKIAGLNILTPDSIKIPCPERGVREVPNPFPIIDPASGTQKGVWVKKLVAGYGPTGAMAITSTTLYYDFSLYFLEDIQRKVRFNKEAGRLTFREQLTEEEKATGLFVPIEGDFGVWANTAHNEVQKAISTWLQMKKFGERKAQTVAERNAMKHHPALALQLGTVQGGQKFRWAKTVVTGWMHDHTQKELEEMALGDGETIKIADEEVEVTDVSEKLENEDVYAAEDTDFEEAAEDDGRLF